MCFQCLLKKKQNTFLQQGRLSWSHHVKIYAQYLKEKTRRLFCMQNQSIVVHTAGLHAPQNSVIEKRAHAIHTIVGVV